MVRTVSILITILILFAFSCKPKVEEKNILFVGNGSIRVGVIPSLGGTVVSLSKNNGPNVLLSQIRYWNIPDSMQIPLSSRTPYVPVNGHTVWLGPQAEWWLQQDIDTVLKKLKAVWPPDPYLVQAKYEVTERSDALLGMLSPASPFTGIQFEKKIRIEAEGKVSLQVLAKNTRNSMLAWDIWFNTRVHAFDRVYVPVKDTARLHIIEKNDSLVSGFQSRIADGYFTFIPEVPEAGKKLRSSKVFIYPDKPYIAAFCDNYLLIIRFPGYPQSSLHPMQSLVEIYLRTSSDPDEDLMELEHHSPYKSLKPGEIMDAWESWELFEYHGKVDMTEQIVFLRNLGL